MKISLSSESFVSQKVDLLAVGVHSPKPAKDPVASKLDRAVGGALLRCIKEEDFTAKRGATLILQGRGRLRAKRLLLVGLGSRSEKSREREARLLAVKAARASQDRSSLAVVAPGISEALVATAAGLAAAIPAVIAFNFFMNKIRIVETELQSFSADFLNIIERDILRIERRRR